MSYYDAILLPTELSIDV